MSLYFVQFLYKRKQSASVAKVSCRSAICWIWWQEFRSIVKRMNNDKQELWAISTPYNLIIVNWNEWLLLRLMTFQEAWCIVGLVLFVKSQGGSRFA